MRMLRAKWNTPPPRPKGQGKFYRTPRWRRVRLAKLLHQGGMCEACGAVPFNPKALHVDHIVPLANGGEPYNHANLQVLCASCHSKKTVRESNSPSWLRPKQDMDTDSERAGGRRPGGGG